MKNFPFNLFFRNIILFIISYLFVVTSKAVDFSVINPNPVGNSNSSGNMSCIDDGGNDFVCYDTIQDAIDASNNGDRIYVQAGTYNEVLTINKEISLLCQSGAILDGNGINSAGVTIRSSNVTIEGCEIVNYKKGIINYFDKNDPLTWIGYQNIIIRNNNIHDLVHSYVNDYTSMAIQFGKNTDTFLTGDPSEGTEGYLVAMNDVDINMRLDFSGLIIENNQSDAVYGGLDLLSVSGPITVRNNVFTNMLGSDIAIDSSSNIVLDSNILTGNKYAGIWISNSEDNDISYNGVSPEWWFSTGSDGSYDMWKVGNGALGPQSILITNNTIIGNGHYVSWYGGDSYFEKIANNGISILSNPSEITVSGNLISNNNWARLNGHNGGNGLANLLPSISDGQVNALHNDWFNGGSLSDLPNDNIGEDGSIYDTNPFANSNSDYVYGNVLYATATLTNEYNLNSCFGLSAVDSISGINGDLINSPTWATGYTHQGLEFDGVDDYIDLSALGGINLGTSHTLSVWLNFDDLSDPTKNVIFGETTIPNAQYAFWFQNSSNIYYRAGSSWVHWNVAPITTNNWYHFAIVRNGLNVELFINGNSQGSQTLSDNDSLIINYIGKENNTATVQYHFDGIMDEVRFYNGILSSSDIVSLYNSYAYNPTQCNLDTPVYLGNNLRSKSTALGELPVDVACGGITNGDFQEYGDGRISGVWTNIDLYGYTVKYEKQWVYPGGDPNNPSDWHGNEIWNTNYTNYRTFGSSVGTEGLWYNRVRAFIDYNNDGSADMVSAWSNPCAVTYDRTPPAKPTGLRRIAPNEGNRIYACGDYSKIQRMWPDWDDNTEPDFDHYEYTSFNAPNGDIGLYRRVFYNSIFQYNGGWMPNEGTYGFSVRAVDTAGNVSDWALIDETLSGSCQITYDDTPPVSDVFIQGDLDETKDLAHNNGWHGYGWYESFDNVDLQITSGDTINDTINYQILNGDVSCPTQGSGYSTTSHGTNLASFVNAFGDGVYTLCFYAEDLAGNIESATHKVLLHLDNTNPTYTITGANGNLVNDGLRDIHYLNSDSIEIYLDVADNLSGYTRVRFDLYTADNDWNCTYSAWRQDNLLPPSTSTSITLNDSVLADGRYCYRVWIYDDVQNKAWWDTNNEGWVYFVIDTTPPTADELSDRVFYEGENGTITLPKAYDDNQVYFSASVLYVDPKYPALGPITSLFISDDKMTEDPVSSGIWVRDIDGSDGHTDPNQDYLIDTSLYALGSEGVYSVVYSIRDEAGNTSPVYTATYTIENVAPNVLLSSSQTINEGETAILSGLFTDPSSLGSLFYDDGNWSISIDYGDGMGFVNLGSMNVTGAISYNLNHTYINSGTYTVTLRVCEGENDVNSDGLIDGEGVCGENSVLVTVNNIAPSVSISSSPSTNVDEGTNVTLTANTSSGNSPLSFNWSGDCSGNNATYMLPSVAGTYNCTVTVTDVDGDIATDSITVVVNSTQNNNSNDNSNNGSGNVLGDSTKNFVSKLNQETGDIDGELGSFDEENDKGKVLGLSCDATTKLFGYIYIDKNKNDKFDDGDEAIIDRNINIYAYVDGERKLIISPITDENGYWEIDLCPGNYELELDNEKLDKKLKIKGEKVKKITVYADSENTVDFILEESRGFNWLICLLPLGILVILMVLLWIVTKKREKDEYDSIKMND